jgi:hypothetical protein
LRRHDKFLEPVEIMRVHAAVEDLHPIPMLNFLRNHQVMGPVSAMVAGAVYVATTVPLAVRES